MELQKIHDFLIKINKLDFSRLEIQTDDLKVNFERTQNKSEKTSNETDIIEDIKEDTKDDTTLKEEIDSNSKKITAPISGVFYRASEPGAEPFVKEGDTVKKGQTLCYLEAMKMMNEIKAFKNGVITDILVENDTQVNEGDELFILKGE